MIDVLFRKALELNRALRDYIDDSGIRTRAVIRVANGARVAYTKFIRERR